MDRPIDISINVEPGTSYILTDSQGEFDPPLPTNIKAGDLIQTQCQSPAKFKYGGSCDTVEWEVEGAAHQGVLNFAYMGLESVNADMLDGGKRYRVGITFAPS